MPSGKNLPVMVSESDLARTKMLYQDTLDPKLGAFNFVNSSKLFSKIQQINTRGTPKKSSSALGAKHHGSKVKLPQLASLEAAPQSDPMKSNLQSFKSKYIKQVARQQQHELQALAPDEFSATVPRPQKLDQDYLDIMVKKSSVVKEVNHEKIALRDESKLRSAFAKRCAEAGQPPAEPHSTSSAEASQKTQEVRITSAEAARSPAWLESDLKTKLENKEQPTVQGNFKIHPQRLQGKMIIEWLDLQVEQQCQILRSIKKQQPDTFEEAEACHGQILNILDLCLRQVIEEYSKQKCVEWSLILQKIQTWTKQSHSEIVDGYRNLVLDLKKKHCADLKAKEAEIERSVEEAKLPIPELESRICYLESDARLHEEAREIHAKEAREQRAKITQLMAALAGKDALLEQKDA